MLLAAFFVALADWSWRKWPDILVDFGQQLYIPWQLAAGKRLFTDIALMHGPFSQYFNAVWFRLLGPSLSVLVYVNLAILAAITAGIYAIVRRMTGVLAAAVACFVFLGLFAFCQYATVGNYNYVCPYVHEATHGIALSIAMIILLIRYIDRGGRLACAGAGACLGVALLTKVDVAVAAGAVAVTALAVIAFERPSERAASRADVALFAGCAVAPAVAFFFYFLTYLPARDALAAVTAGFTVVSGDVAANQFYRHGLGLDDVGGNLGQIAWMLGGIVLFVVSAAAVDWTAGRFLKGTRLVSALLGAAAFTLLVLEPDLVAWRELARALPATTLLALGAVVVAFFRRRSRQGARHAVTPVLLCAVFAAALLVKMGLNVHLYHYGFYLAMPATLLLAVGLVHWWPVVLKTRLGGSGLVFQSLALAVLAAAIVFHLRASQAVYAAKDFPIGSGGDTILAYRPQIQAPSSVTLAALQWIESQMPPSATFVALPEGISLNYLTRRATTLRQMNFMMTEMIVFGEPAIVAGLDRRPPDYIVLVDKDTSEFGVGPFGRDPRYGQLIMDWVREHYDSAVLIGRKPFQGAAAGIEILKRRITDTAAAHSPRSGSGGIAP